MHKTNTPSFILLKNNSKMFLIKQRIQNEL